MVTLSWQENCFKNTSWWGNKRSVKNTHGGTTELKTSDFWATWEAGLKANALLSHSHVVFSWTQHREEASRCFSPGAQCSSCAQTTKQETGRPFALPENTGTSKVTERDTGLFILSRVIVVPGYKNWCSAEEQTKAVFSHEVGGHPLPTPSVGDHASARQPRGRMSPPCPKLHNQGRAHGCCGRDLPLDAGPETGSLGWSLEAAAWTR